MDYWSVRLFCRDVRFDLSSSCRKQINKSEYRIIVRLELHNTDTDRNDYLIMTFSASHAEIKVFRFLKLFVSPDNLSLKLSHYCDGFQLFWTQTCQSQTSLCEVYNFRVLNVAVVSIPSHNWLWKCFLPKEIGLVFYFVWKLLLSWIHWLVSGHEDTVLIIFKWCY